MAMRIWHQSFTVLSDLGAYDEALKEHFRNVARPDTEIVMHGMRPGTYRSNYPGDDIRHVALQHLHSIQFVQAGWQAQKDGFDAYAISTHRSQGSEYPIVVMPVMTQHYMMLQRNLLYTAVTRAKKIVVLVGTRRAVQMAVENNKVAERYSGLLQLLGGENRL